MKNSPTLQELATQLRIARTLAVCYPNNQNLRREYEQLLIRWTFAREAELEDVS